jgi:hypothetical protein
MVCLLLMMLEMNDLGVMMMMMGWLIHGLMINMLTQGFIMWCLELVFTMWINVVASR